MVTYAQTFAAADKTEKHPKSAAQENTPSLKDTANVDIIPGAKETANVADVPLISETGQTQLRVREEPHRTTGNAPVDHAQDHMKAQEGHASEHTVKQGSTEIDQQNKEKQQHDNQHGEPQSANATDHHDESLSQQQDNREREHHTNQTSKEIEVHQQHKAEQRATEQNAPQSLKDGDHGRKHDQSGTESSTQHASIDIHDQRKQPQNSSTERKAQQAPADNNQAHAQEQLAHQVSTQSSGEHKGGEKQSQNHTKADPNHDSKKEEPLLESTNHATPTGTAVEDKFRQGATANQTPETAPAHGGPTQDVQTPQPVAVQAKSRGDGEYDKEQPASSAEQTTQSTESKNEHPQQGPHSAHEPVEAQRRNANTAKPDTTPALLASQSPEAHVLPSEAHVLPSEAHVLPSTSGQSGPGDALAGSESKTHAQVEVKNEGNQDKSVSEQQIHKEKFPMPVSGSEHAQSIPEAHQHVEVLDKSAAPSADSDHLKESNISNQLSENKADEKADIGPADTGILTQTDGVDRRASTRQGPHPEPTHTETAQGDDAVASASQLPASKIEDGSAPVVKSAEHSDLAKSAGEHSDLAKLPEVKPAVVLSDLAKTSEVKPAEEHAFAAQSTVQSHASKEANASTEGKEGTEEKGTAVGDRHETDKPTTVTADIQDVASGITEDSHKPAPITEDAGKLASTSADEQSAHTSNTSGHNESVPGDTTATKERLATVPEHADASEVPAQDTAMVDQGASDGSKKTVHVQAKKTKGTVQAKKTKGANSVPAA
jgi:hypothetical protein